MTQPQLALADPEDLERLIAATALNCTTALQKTLLCIERYRNSGCAVAAAARTGSIAQAMEKQEKMLGDFLCSAGQQQTQED